MWQVKYHDVQGDSYFSKAALSEHQAPCLIQTLPQYVWKVVEIEVKPEQKNWHFMQIVS